MAFKAFSSWLRNPFVSAVFLAVANIFSFIPFLQDPFFFMFGVLGNFFLTFCFSYLTMLTALNIDRILKTVFFKYIGYLVIGVYFYFYFTWIFSIHYTFVLGYFIMSYGVYWAFRFHLGKKPSKRDFF